MRKTVTKLFAVLLAVALLFSSMSVMSFAENALPYDDSSFYSQGDYTIHYRHIAPTGESKGRILFIHGFLYSSATWYDAAEIMSESGYDCYLVDLPDYGYSTRENGEIEKIDREDLLVGLMESVAPVDEWIIAGHSMGGGVAMNIACDHPELKALLLFCPSEVNMPGEKILNGLTESSFFQKIFTGMFNAIVKCPLVAETALFAVTKDIDYAMSYNMDILKTPLLLDGTATGIFYSMAYSRNTDMTAISEIEVPTMLVWADDDIVLSSSNIDNISAALEGTATEYTIDGSHIVIETNPDTVAMTSIKYLTETFG